MNLSCLFTFRNLIGKIVGVNNENNFGALFAKMRKNLLVKLINHLHLLRN